MYIIHSRLEYSIWVTDDPYNPKSGLWYFCDDEDGYEYEFDRLTKKYKGAQIYTLRYWERTAKARRGDKDE